MTDQLLFPSHGSAHAPTVTQQQRTKILEAMTKVAGEEGTEAATLARVAEVAGISGATVGKLFADRGECLLAALEQAVAMAGLHCSRAYRAELRWADRIRSGFLALLELFDADRALARLCLIESATLGPAGHGYRAGLLAQLAALIDEGRSAARNQPPPFTAEGVVGGILTVVQTRLLDPETEALVELINPLMSFIVFPYLGGGAARSELSYAHPQLATPQPLDRCDGVS